MGHHHELIRRMLAHAERVHRRRAAAEAKARRGDQEEDGRDALIPALSFAPREWRRILTPSLPFEQPVDDQQGDADAQRESARLKEGK
jgi:hypothetical protein